MLEPSTVLVAVTLAAALVLVEVALPTFGVAGLSAVALGGLALVAARQQDLPWWPLSLVVAAVCWWSVLLATRRADPPAQAGAAAMFTGGSVGYGVLAGDPTTVAIAVGGSIVLPLAFRPLLRATNRLLELPAQSGMEALVGCTGTVVQWDGRAGTVRVEGSLWNARSTDELAPGADVVVVGHDRMTVHVALHSAVP